MKTLQLFLLLVLFWIVAATGAHAANLTVSVIDCGQGDSILVQFPNGQNMLVDAANSSVTDYIDSRGIRTIDILVATHPHADHIGGMLEVLGRYKIGKIWDSGYVHGSQTQINFLEKIKAKFLQFGQPRAGFSQQIGDARIDVLAPGERLLGGTDSDPNNNSLVMSVSYGSTSFLLTGDMQDEERGTIESWQKSTVLKVSHHGSHNGTDAEFAKQVSPQFAAISVGAGNTYGHPDAGVIAALTAIGAQVYRTDQSGTIVFTSDGKNVTVKTLKAADSSPPASVSPVSSSDSYASGTQYIGNKNTHKFHLPSCSYLPMPKNRVYFDTRKQAIDAGYVPCKKCNP